MGVPGNADLLLLKTAAAAGGYQVSRSLRFNGSVDSTYLNRTPASAGNRKTWTWSGWIKRSTLTSSAYSLFAVYTDGSNRAYISYQGSTDKILLYSRVGGADVYEYSTNAVFRDASAWYHVVVAFDTTQATASNRLKIYVNGVEQSITTATAVGQNVDTYYNTTQPHYIGYQGGGDAYFSGYMADIWFLDGIAADPSSFAETDATTGQWIPKTYSGSKGSNGFHLEFADNSAATATTLGKDTANSNNWTPNNFSVTAGAGNDSLVDTPASYGTDDSLGGSVRGNYATINPLAGNTIHTVSNGNLTLTATNSNWSRKISTIGMSSGKWYAEFTFTTAGNNTNQVGVISFLPPVNANNQNGEETGQSMYNGYNGDDWNGTIFNDGSRVSTGNTIASSGDVIGVALDASANNVKYYRNGTLVGSSSGYTPTNVSGTWYFVTQCLGSGVVDCNYGQRAWAYTPPANYKALVDTNLTAPVIAKPNTVMDVKLYTGTGSSQTISGLGFSPDFVWIKERSADRNHRLQDSVRGANVSLRSNSTAAEATNAIDGYLSAFTSDGFTTAAGSSSILDVGESSGTYVAWAWDAGTTTSSNGSGSIISSVRANASAGFSIITYSTGGTGSTLDTVGHGLNVAPVMLLLKNRDQGFGWLVARSDFSNPTQDYMFLNSTDAKANAGTATWSFSSTTVGIRQSAACTVSGSKMVVYAFAPVAGYSSFGSYTGNGSSDGPFVYTGFRPRWILFKNANSSATSWDIYDTARNTYNLSILRLFADQSIAESNDYDFLDINSNGFKIRNNNLGNNGSGNTIVYAAFAESPFQYARAR